MTDTDTAIGKTSPVNLVVKYFTHQIYSLLAEQTNQRYLKEVENEFNIIPSEKRQLMEICILMDDFKFPLLRMCGETNYCISCIANAMVQKTFLSIFTNLGAKSGDEPPFGTTNVYWKV